MGRGEVDVGMRRVVNCAPFAVRIVWDVEFADRAGEAAVESGDEQNQGSAEEDDQAEKVGGFALFV